MDDRNGSNAEIAIGPYVLPLDLRFKHDRLYSDNPVTIDTLLADRFLRSGDVVLDAGANIGFTALHYLKRGASKVHAIEPIPDLCRRLRRLGATGLEVHELALSNRTGEADIFLSRSHNQGHSLNEAFLKAFPSVFGKDTETLAVRVETLDNLFPDSSFDYWKIDIEGSEEEFLEGCMRQLSDRRPRLVQIEIYPSEFEGVFEVLARFFRYAARAIARPDTDHLLLVEVGQNVSQHFPNQPPVFLFTDEPFDFDAVWQ